MELKKLESRAEFEAWQDACKKRFAAQNRKIFVCCGSVCLAEGAMKIYSKLKESLQREGLLCDVVLGTHLEDGAPGFALEKTGCSGMCDNGPLVRIEPEGWLYRKVSTDDVEEIVQKTILGGEYIDRLGLGNGTEVCKTRKDLKFFDGQTRRVLRNCGEIDAENIEEAVARDEYSGFVKALFDMAPEQILDTVAEAGLRGRGGPGNISAEKWRKAAACTDAQKTMLVNDGQLDVGSYMDRAIVEGDPHRLIEGMAIVALACGIEEGYAYVHPQYQVAEFRLKKAKEQAEAAGLLGDNILGSGKNFHLHVNAGMRTLPEREFLKMSANSVRSNKKTWYAKSYMDANGEIKPATVDNNVETIANVPDIIFRGAQWFRSCGTEQSPGTKLFMLTGNVNHTGMIEIPFGTTVREVVENVGGGMEPGKPFKAMMLGGRVLLTSEYLDFPITFENLEELGEHMGTGGLDVMDTKASIMETSKYLLRFAARGSCGRCTPCREGIPRVTVLLEKMAKGEGTKADLEELIELATLIQDSALCFETCTGVESYEIDKTVCIGCTKCARNCPVGAIKGTIRQPHEIDHTKCIKCGTCFRGCPKHAVKENNPWPTNS